MTNLDSIFKSRDITLPTKVRLVKAMVFLVVMYGCESWTVKNAVHSWPHTEAPSDLPEDQTPPTEPARSWAEQMQSPYRVSHTSVSTKDAQRAELQLQDCTSLDPVRKYCQCWCWQQGWCYKL